MGTKTIADILKKCEKVGDCFIWKHSTGGSRPYPSISHQGKGWRGNRLVYLLHNGKLPIEKVVRHICDNTKCLNPHHLIIGTQKQNMRDASERKRFPKQHNTECLYGHIYTKENTAYDNKGKRRCKTCAKLLMRKRNGYNGFRKSKTDSSQFPGVSFEARQKKWSARIKTDGKYKRLGMFKTETEAINKIKVTIK